MFHRTKSASWALRSTVVSYSFAAEGVSVPECRVYFANKSRVGYLLKSPDSAYCFRKNTELLRELWPDADWDAIEAQRDILAFSDAVSAAMARTKDNAGLKLNIALNYGGRDELLRAAKVLAARAAAGEIRPEDITRSDLENALYTHGLPDVDLLIRTSGEMRISNFLLYQIAYAEFVVTDTLWPDFDVRALHEAIAAYQKRDRRFGGVKTGAKGDDKA